MLSRHPSFIMMMPPTHFWDFPDRAHLWPLDRPWHRTIHGQTPVRAPVMVVLKVLGQESHEMSFVQNDHVVQAFADLLGNRGTAGRAWLAQLSPVVAKALALPVNDGTRLDERQGALPL
jgi:hypothetical protein